MALCEWLLLLKHMTQARPLNCTTRLLKITISKDTCHNLEYFAYVKSHALPGCVSSLKTKLWICKLAPQPFHSCLTLQLQASFFSLQMNVSWRFIHWLKKHQKLLDPDAGKDQRQKKRAAEDEMVGWHHHLNRHELAQTPGDGGGQRAWCAPAHGVAKSWI